MNEQLDFIRIVVRRLDDAGIPYLITGSIALSVYVTPRMTRDIDVVIECDETQAAALATAFQVDSYASEDAAREAVRTTGMFNVVHNESLFKADFIIKKQDRFNIQRFARRRSVDLGEFLVYVSSPEDLILAKLLWSRSSGSARQRDDVRALLSGVTNLDWAYLSAEAAQLGVSSVLEELKT